MINLINTPYMTQKQRQDSLQRSLHSQPFFNLLDFGTVLSTVKRPLYGAKADVDKDFYLTEAKANFGPVYYATAGSFFDLSLYIANQGQSVYRYISGENLPTAFQVTDIRYSLPLPGPTALFCDLQDELNPLLIKRGDSIITRAQYVNAPGGDVEIKIVLSGYYVNEQVYIADFVQKSIDESLQGEPLFETWKFEVDYTGQNIHILNNDRTARMILGFGIVLKEDGNLNTVPTGTVQITDPYRKIRFNNIPLFIDFFAPKVNQVQDVNIYYLPVEYFWQPLAPMKFEIVNALNGGTGYEWVMFTRTV